MATSLHSGGLKELELHECALAVARWSFRTIVMSLPLQQGPCFATLHSGLPSAQEEGGRHHATSSDMIPESLHSPDRWVKPRGVMCENPANRP